MKRLIVIILAAAVIITGLSSVVSYQSNDGISNQRGWPVGYYQYDNTTTNNNPTLSLCSGANVGNPYNQNCDSAAPVLNHSRVALNFGAWLVVSSFAISGLYLYRQKTKHPRANPQK